MLYASGDQTNLIIGVYSTTHHRTPRKHKGWLCESHLFWQSHGMIYYALCALRARGVAIPPYTTIAKSIRTSVPGGGILLTFRHTLIFGATLHQQQANFTLYPKTIEAIEDRTLADTTARFIANLKGIDMPPLPSTRRADITVIGRSQDHAMLAERHRPAGAPFCAACYSREHPLDIRDPPPVRRHSRPSYISLTMYQPVRKTPESRREQRRIQKKKHSHSGRPEHSGGA